MTTYDYDDENIAPWQRKTEAKIEEKQVTQTEVHCKGCDHTWNPNVERPKNCPECKAKLNYVDELQEEQGEDTESDKDEEEDDLDSLFDSEDGE